MQMLQPSLPFCWLFSQASEFGFIATSDAMTSTLSLQREASKGALMGAVKGGGRLFAGEPLSGYTEEEMCAEARERLAHNRQRRRMKQLLSAASQDGTTVSTKDLLLSAKLAKMDLPDEMVAETKYAMGIDYLGVPTKVAWKPFYSQLPPPALRGPGGFGQLPPLRKNRPAIIEAGPMETGPAVVIDEGPADDEVTYWFGVMQNKMRERFAEVRRGFRQLDKDASGNLDRDEFRQILTMFNLQHMPDAVLSKILSLTDFDGDGTVNFAEFARLITAENVLNMKKTLSALGEDQVAAAKVRAKMSQGANVDKETGVNVKLRRTGPGLEKMRRFHRTLRDLLAAEFGEGDRGMKACFAKIDADSSGLVRRAELRNFLKKYSRSTPDNVISGLIDYVDTDGDAKTLSLSEFLTMMRSDFLE